MGNLKYFDAASETWKYVSSSMGGGGNGGGSVGWQTLGSSTPISWDLSLGNAKVILTSNSLLSTPTNMVAGEHYFIAIIQGGSGGYYLSFDTGYKFTDNYYPFPTAAVNAEDVFVFESDGTYMINTGIYKNVIASNGSPLSYFGNLHLWLRADAQAFSSGITPAENSDTVYKWKDQSIYSNNALQITYGNRPVLKTGIINSLPVIRFDGATTRLDLDGLDAGNNFSIFIVVKPASTSPVGMFDSAPGQTNVIRNNSGSWEWWDSSPAVDLSLGNTDAVLLEFIHSLSPTRNIDYYNNGSLISSNPNASEDPAAWLNPNIGSINTGESFFEGDIAEILIYAETISTTHREAVETYLMTKYGLT
jgi:hypothetical protein